ncbi:MAG: glycosyltransferase family 2 protein [bacterium]|nr:glycosyltransferase family 2 protein [bacterium]
MARLSAVVVNYNGGDMVMRCVDSLLAYSPDGGIEVIVVDNASDDDSPDKLAARDDITFIRNDKNLGFAAGCNVGLERATGEYLALVNPDLEVGEGLLDALIEFIRDTEGAGIVSPAMERDDGTPIQAHRRLPSLPLMVGSRKSPLTKLWPDNPITRKFLYLDLDPNKAHRIEMVAGTLMVFSRELCDEIGGLDEGYFIYVEDADFCLRAARAGYGVYYLPYLVAKHYSGFSTSQRPYSMILAHHRSLLRFFFLNRPLHFLSYIILWPFAVLYILLELMSAWVKRRSNAK